MLKLFKPEKNLQVWLVEFNAKKSEGGTEQCLTEQLSSHLTEVITSPPRKKISRRDISDAREVTYYKPFGAIDTSTEKAYNVNSGTYSNTTYKSKNTYNGFMDELSKVTAMNGTTVLGENVMTYPDGNTFTVTDGNVKYKTAYSNAENETTWSVYEGATEKVLKKQTVTESSTGTTSAEKYYNAEGNSPTYTETTVTNAYGREITKGAATYDYNNDRDESPCKSAPYEINVSFHLACLKHTETFGKRHFTEA